MSNTPRTDAAQHNVGSIVEPHYVVDIAFARQLERELAEARNQRDKAIAFLKVYRNDTPLGNQPHMIAHEVDLFLKGCGK
jgi:hypothetical protein